MERTETHPRNAILMLWAGAMIGMLIAAVLSFQVLAFFLIVIIFFYFLTLFKLYKCWRHFKYSGGFFLGISAAAIAVIFTIAHFAHVFMEMMLP